MTLIPPKWDWSEAWELPPIEGIMLQDADITEHMLSLVREVDTGALLLSSLQFDSLFSLWLAIDCWTGSVMSLPYALDPDFVTLQIALDPDLT